MSKNHRAHQHQGLDPKGDAPAHIPYWQRAHSDWRFWIGVILMLVAMVIYLATGDLAVQPKIRPEPPRVDSK